MSTRRILICEKLHEYFDPYLLQPDIDGVTFTELVHHLVWQRWVWEGGPMRVVFEHDGVFDEIFGRDLDSWTDVLSEIARESIEQPTRGAVFKPEQAARVLQRCIDNRERLRESELEDSMMPPDVSVSDEGRTLRWRDKDGQCLVASGSTAYEAYRECQRIAEHVQYRDQRRRKMECEPLPPLPSPPPNHRSFMTKVERIVGFSGFQSGGEIVTRLTCKVTLGGLAAFASLGGCWVRVLVFPPMSLSGWQVVREHGRSTPAILFVEKARWDDPQRYVTLLGRRDAGNGVEMALRENRCVRVDPIDAVHDPDAPRPAPAWAVVDVTPSGGSREGSRKVDGP